MPTPSNTPTPARAFTLIEAAAAIAVVASASALVVFAGDPFSEGPEVCQARQREILEAMHAYALNNQMYYPGPNTSGAEGQFTNGSIYTGDRTPSTPTTTHDFISPLLGTYSALSPNRAHRTQQILSKLACEAATEFTDGFFGAAPDQAQFLKRQQHGGFRQVSYLSPAQFHYFASNAAADAHRYRGLRLRVGAPNPARVPDSFLPRLDLVGTDLSRKVFIADGHRYLDANGNSDIDISTNPALFSWFTDSGPIFDASTSYGRTSPSGGAQLPLTFRHRGQSINTGNFDGSVSTLSNVEAWTDASRWYPTGSIFNGISATPESNGFHTPGQVLP